MENKNYKTLINKLKSADLSCEPSSEEVTPLLYDFYFAHDHRSILNLVNHLARFYFVSYSKTDESFDSYSNAYDFAVDFLDDCAFKAGEIFGGKEIYQNFFRESFKLQKWDKWVPPEELN